MKSWISNFLIHPFIFYHHVIRTQVVGMLEPITGDLLQPIANLGLDDNFEVLFQDEKARKKNN